MKSLLFLALALVPSAAMAQDAVISEREEPAGPRPIPTMEAAYRSGAIDVDGRIDEDAWLAASPIGGFIQGEPVEGVPAEERTHVRVLFDDDAIYVAARMYESDPSRIGDQLVRRDERGSYDWFSVALDPNRDGRTGYNFQVSASGVQLDTYLYNDDQQDAAWDAVWESSVRRDSLGWTAEIRIPLSQIRYDSGEGAQTWGVNFARRRLAANELSYFALKSRIREGLVSQFGVLTDVRVGSGGRRIEMRPYLLSSVHDGPADEGDPFFDGRSLEARVGADLRVGLGSAFTLDATVNPDFGQVEADPAVINLSAFETFLEERRPFFVEDAQVFDFGLSGHRNQLFYSRRIGRNPHGGAPSDSDFDHIPEAATILGAAKLTGRTQGGLSMGAMAAVTQEESGRAYFAGGDELRDFVVEPRTEYGVFRLQQDLNGGASQVGGIFTALHRELPGDGSFEYLPDQAYSAGLRFEHQWNQREWKLAGFFAGSHVRGSEASMVRIQRASNHYFHRPDATRLSVDSAATSLSGAEWRLQLDRQNGRHWTGSLWLAEVTNAFEINDLGFSQSAERLDGGARVSYREIQPGSWYRDYNVSLFTYHNISHEALDAPWSLSSWSGAHMSGSVNLNGRTTLRNNWNGDVNLSWSPDRYSYSATRGGPVMRDPAQWSIRGGLNTDRRRDLSFRGGFNVRRGAFDSGSETTVSGSVSLRATPQLEIAVEPRFSVQTDGAQYVTATEAVPFEPTFGRRYVFGDLDRTSFSMETRASWTFSPTLSFQLFAQPLLSSGAYARYKQLASARSFDFDAFEPGTTEMVDGEVFCRNGSICTTNSDDGGVVQNVDVDGDGAADFAFADRDFNVRSLVGNAVLRWEYRPGSTVFFVWQRRQAGRTGVGDFDFGRDLDALFDIPSDDRFIIKVNYWLGL